MAKQKVGQTRALFVQAVEEWMFPMLGIFYYLVSYVIVQHANNRSTFAVGYGIKNFIHFWGMPYINLPFRTHKHTQ